MAVQDRLEGSIVLADTAPVLLINDTGENLTSIWFRLRSFYGLIENQFMEVTINGYVSYSCDHCAKPHTIEGVALAFAEDASPECEDDDYILYIAQIDKDCVSCGNKALLTIETWEHPEAVTNYSYNVARGARNIQCEFTIEHYFDDEMATDEDPQPQTDVAEGDDRSPDDEQQFNESPAEEGYTDEYDDED